LVLLCLGVYVTAQELPVLTTAAHAQEPDEGEKGAASKPATTHESGPFLRFIYILKSVGIVFGALLLLVSIGLLTLIVLLFMELRLGVAIPPGFVEDFTETLNKRRFKEAYELAKEDNSYLARVLTAGMSRLQYGLDDAREASFNMVDTLRSGKESLVNYLATIGGLGPLIGLVGTVWGMIGSFMTLAAATSAPNAQLLANNISEALAITLMGIGLAVPAIFFHTFFRNRLVRLAHDIGTVADDLLTQMYHNSKKPGAPASPGSSGEVAADVRGVAAGSIKPK